MFESGDLIVPRDHLREWPDWALIVEEIEGDGTLRAAPQGGGPLYSFDPLSVRKFDFVKVPKSLLHNPPWFRVKFYAEWLEKSYEGWTTGERWNGWAKPYFEFNEAMRYARDAGNTIYDPSRDAFVTRQEDHDEDEVDEGTTILVPGHGPIHAYPIGAGSWTWDIVREGGDDEDEDEEE